MTHSVCNGTRLMEFNDYAFGLKVLSSGFRISCVGSWAQGSPGLKMKLELRYIRLNIREGLVEEYILSWGVKHFKLPRRCSPAGAKRT